MPLPWISTRVHAMTQSPSKNPFYKRPFAEPNLPAPARVIREHFTHSTPRQGAKHDRDRFGTGIRMAQDAFAEVTRPTTSGEHLRRGADTFSGRIGRAPQCVSSGSARTHPTL